MPKYETIEKSIERRTYIRGKFKGKFIGYFDPMNSDGKFENFYDLEVLSVEIKTTKNETNIRHWKLGELGEFREVEEFLTKLPDNIPIEIIDENGMAKSYSIKLNDTKLKSCSFSNQLYEGNKVFGDIAGEISGYLKHYDIVNEIREIEDQIPIKINPSSQTSECIKQTGEIEVSRDYKYWETLGSILFISLLILGWKIILPIAILFGILYFFSLLSKSVDSIFKLFFGFLGIVFLLSFSLGILSLVTGSLRYRDMRKTSGIDEIKELTKIEENPTLGDSIISHHRIWQDYSNNKYEVDLKMCISDFKDASRLRNNLSIPLSSSSNYNRIVSTIYDYDLNKLDLVYDALDGLQVGKKLNKLEFAEVIVSLVQDIPYSLILGDACDASIYADDFIKDYLAGEGDCQGYTKYGLLTPVEFISTLKGDCDTRTLLLFTIFNHYNYDVAMLSSELYKHSIIGINLPYKGISKSINGKKYVVWETTGEGIPPGLISPEISDMRFWNVSLISNKNLPI